MPQSTNLPPGYTLKTVPFQDEQWRTVKADAALQGVSVREYFYRLIEDAIERKKKGRKK